MEANWRSSSWKSSATNWRRGTNGNKSDQFSNGNWLCVMCDVVF
jgi:hypothetical protein